ncbi:beta-ketoacyl synthase N-terminal-like domain-containing protein [Bacillus velezensis]|nr:beta-ketoacyl synthase N-terminal-like domain-containing protein [Bacillus velezensis]
MSGRFPQARTADELWDILFQEKDVVAPVAKKASQVQNGNSALYRGGRIRPFIFEISPREAETMDPKQRRFFRKRGGPLRTPATAPVTSSDKTIGMFVGAEEGDYHL